MANMLAQIFLLWDLTVWKIVTPLVISSISLLSFYYVTGYFYPTLKSPTVWHDFTLAAVCAVFPGFMPVAYNLYGDTFMWLDGSCNYLYPLFFMLVGFIPIYNAIRARNTPAFFVYVSPASLLIAGILHEQMAMLIFAMCLSASLYLIKSGQMTKYIMCLFILSIFIMIFTFTCPGAYKRYILASTIRKSGGLRYIILHIFPFYINEIFSSKSSYWFWMALLGICSIFMLYGITGKIKVFLSIYLIVSIGLFGIPGILNKPLPGVTNKPESTNIVSVIAACYWVWYLLFSFISMIMSARQNRRYRYVVILYVGMWASQGIPALLGSLGRPLLPLIYIAFLITASVFDEIKYRYSNVLKMVAATVGSCFLISFVQISVRNYAAYQNILYQINDVKEGKSDTIIIDYSQLNSRYFYFNAFSLAYTSEIKQYYELPKNAKLNIKG